MGWERSARVDEAELTEASEERLMTEALLSGVPGKDRESLCCVRLSAAPLGEDGADC